MALVTQSIVDSDITAWRTDRPAPAAGLICLPYAGGTVSGFRGWAEQLPEQVELVVARYPGRERRYGQAPPTHWLQLVDDCVESLDPYLRRWPSVLFGHSLGALLAHELALRSAANGWLTTAVVVSEHAGPHRRPVPSLPAGAGDEAVVRWLERHGNLPAVLLADPHLRALAIELLRADLRAYRSYWPDPRSRHDLPVQVLYAIGGAVGQQRAEEWARSTTAGCTVTGLPGGHFYTPPIWRQLPQHIPALRGVNR